MKQYVKNTHVPVHNVFLICVQTS